MSDMAEGWDHDLGGVFSGRAQRELPRYKADQLFTSANRARYQRHHVVGRRGDRTRSGSRRFFLHHRFFARRDSREQHDPGRSLSGSILTEGRLERQFSVSDLG